MISNEAPGTSKTKNILYVIAGVDLQQGGMAHNCAINTRALLAAGHKVTILTLDLPDDRLAEFVRMSACDTIVRMPRSLRRLDISFAAWRWLSKHGGTFDVVHVASLMNMFTSPLARHAVAARSKVVVVLSGMMARGAIRHRSPLLKRAWIALIDRPVLDRAHAVLVDSDEEAREAGLVLGHATDRFTVLAPAVCASEPFVRPSGPCQARVLALSRLHPIKNLEALIDAWPAIRHAIPDARLTIAGDGAVDYRAALMRRAQAADPCEQSITFVGWADEQTRAERFRDADLYVLPSLYESFGRTLIEALAVGLPCIVNEKINLAPRLVEWELGRTFRGSGDLATTVIEALHDTAFRERAALEGASRIAREFSPARAAAALEAVYR